MNIVIIGANGGIGSALLKTISAKSDNAVYATYNKKSKRQLSSHPSSLKNNVHWFSLDLTNEEAISGFADDLKEHTTEIDWLINTSGILHTETQTPEKALKLLSSDFFMQNMAVNALPTLLLAKHFAPFFKHKRNSIFATISAKVGSIEDNQLGGWYSYRCSKAALNMALKNISVEWTRSHKNTCIAALHPGTTDTALSQPFQKNVKPDKLFSPQQTANYLLSVLEHLTPEKTGQFWSWDKQILPW